MIDKTRVEEIWTTPVKWMTDSSPMPTFTMREARELCSDWLAMREIVEALAERDPYSEFEDVCPRLCQHCYEAEDVGHADDCEWAKAVALVGPVPEGK